MIFPMLVATPPLLQETTAAAVENLSVLDSRLAVLEGLLEQRGA